LNSTVSAGCQTTPSKVHAHDFSAALHWYKISAALGSTWAKTRIKEVERKMDFSNERASATVSTLSMAEAADFLGVEPSKLSQAVPSTSGSEIHWSDKLPAKLWKTCTHTFCRMQRYNGHRAMRTYHDGREQMGRAHRCRYDADKGACTCMCAHESPLDHLGDIFSDHTAMSTTRCAEPAQNNGTVTANAGIKCSGDVLVDHPRGVAPDVTRFRTWTPFHASKWVSDTPHLCQKKCEGVGAMCVSLNPTSGKCQCYSGPAVSSQQASDASQRRLRGQTLRDFL
jgi:hypothetical protein